MPTFTIPSPQCLVDWPWDDNPGFGANWKENQLKNMYTEWVAANRFPAFNFPLSKCIVVRPGHYHFSIGAPCKEKHSTFMYTELIANGSPALSILPPLCLAVRSWHDKFSVTIIRSPQKGSPIVALHLLSHYPIVFHETMTLDNFSELSLQCTSQYNYKQRDLDLNLVPENTLYDIWCC